MVGVEFKLNINGVVEEISDQGNADNVAFKTCAGVFTAPVYKTGDWQEHTGQPGEACWVLCNDLYREGVWESVGMWICMASSLCYTPETSTTLQINYTP